MVYNGFQLVSLCIFILTNTLYYLILIAPMDIQTLSKKRLGDVYPLFGHDIYSCFSRILSFFRMLNDRSCMRTHFIINQLETKSGKIVENMTVKFMVVIVWSIANVIRCHRNEHLITSSITLKAAHQLSIVGYSHHYR